MKRILIAFCVFSLSTAAIAQTASTSTPVSVTSKKKASDALKFTEEKHDFGEIKQGVPVTHAFTFQNISNQPIVIESATASCGCTTPTWPQAPLTKSKTDKITAGFNAASAGPFDKTITVKVAGYDLPLELKITGEVLSPENYAKYEATKTKKNSK